MIPIIFYRALLLASDTAAVDALCAALAARGLTPAPLIVTSLKDRDAAAFLRGALARLRPSLIVTMTAFAAGGESKASPLDACDVPVLQVVSATTRRAAWRDSARGLGAADLAMHIVLPELDGRILAGVVAFKDALPAQEQLGFTALASRPELDRVAIVADRIAALVRLQATAASRARDRGADARLSRRARPQRLCGRARRAGERAALCSPTLRARATRLRQTPADVRALLDALAAGAADGDCVLTLAH